MWNSTVPHIEKQAMGEVFKEAQAWVEQKLVSKMKAYSQLWYHSPARIGTM